MEIAHPFGELIGLVFEEMNAGNSLCRLDVSETLFNPHNVMHGGVLYTMADTGMGGALYPLLKEGELCATVEIKITYFKAVREGSLECRSLVVNKGKTIASLESEILNDQKLVAKAYGTYSIFKPKASI
jgi:acyl-CoA thioesterase